MPKRIQRKRGKGWRMPDGAVYVGRNTKWGNPFVKKGGGSPHDRPVHAFSLLVAGRDTGEWVDPKVRQRLLDAIKNDLHELRGRDLACWCPDGAPCHADILLLLANKEPTP